MNSDNVIVFSTDIQTLKGKGTEYLINESGEVIAQFVDGEMECIPCNNDDGFIKSDVMLFVAVAATLIYLYGC